MLSDQVVIDQRLQVFHIKPFDFSDLVRGAEAIEEVQERHPAAQGGGLGDQGHILSLLNRIAGQHSKTGCPRCGDISVVAKDR